MMGICMSVKSRAAKAKSDLINVEVEKDRKRNMHDHDVLLLGLPNSGKGTLVNQMKITHQGGFSIPELKELRPVISKGVLDAAQAIAMHMQKAELECVRHENRAVTDKILDYRLLFASDADPRSARPYFSPEIANSIHQLWTDPIIQKLLDENSAEPCLMEGASYFLGEVLRITEADYIRSQMDALRTRPKRQGITETRFIMDHHFIRILDPGNQHTECRKWIHHFENVPSVIFCAALTDYDQLLSTNRSHNRMAESIMLFDNIVNSGCFLRASVVLLLTKVDLFQDKLPKVPLELYFPDYTGGTDTRKAIKYILWRFMEVNKAKLRVFPHITHLTDMTDMKTAGVILYAVKETVWGIPAGTL